MQDDISSHGDATPPEGTPPIVDRFLGWLTRWRVNFHDVDVTLLLHLPDDNTQFGLQ
jgi:hypothetical protein